MSYTPHEARTKDGRKIGMFGSKEAAEREAKRIGGYTTNERGGKNYYEFMSDMKWKKGW